MTKYIWATDLSQFDVNDEALEKFEKFDTFNEALQDAMNHFHEIDAVTIYVAGLAYQWNRWCKYSCYRISLSS